MLLSSSSVQLAQIRLTAVGITASAVIMVVVAAIVAGGDDMPVIGSAIVVVVGLIALTVIGWLRQRPVAPDDSATYGTTAISKLAVAEIPALVGFVLGIGFGPWWLAAVGLGASIVGFALAWPTESDRERHELLYLV